MQTTESLGNNVEEPIEIKGESNEEPIEVEEETSVTVVKSSAEKKKFLLLNPPGDLTYHRDYFCTLVSKSKYYYHPIDLVYLSGRLDKDYDVHLLDGMAERIGSEDALARIKELNPDYIFFLLAAPSYTNDKKFMEKVKEVVPNAEFIGSGDIYREFREKAMDDHNFLDVICLDFSTEDLLTYLKGANGEVINNIIYKHNGELVIGPEKHGYGKFSMPKPRWDLFKMDKYSFPFARKEPFVSVLSDFGCAYSCTFCPISTLGFKLRQIPEVIDEIRSAKELGAKELHFRDQTFGINKPRTKEFCEALKPLGLGWSAWTRVDVLNDELLQTMKDAGCHTIIFGVETSNEEILKAYKKNTKQSQIIEAMDLCKKNGIRTVGTFIIGLPGETKETVEATIRFSKGINLDFAVFNIATPRFGTTFRKEAIEKGWIDGSKREIESSQSKPVFTNTGITNEEIFELQRRAIREFYLRPGKILKKITDVRSFDEFVKHARNGWALLFNKATVN